MQNLDDLNAISCYYKLKTSKLSNESFKTNH